MSDLFCPDHPEQPVIGTCETCGREVCDLCLEEVDAPEEVSVDSLVGEAARADDRRGASGYLPVDRPSALAWHATERLTVVTIPAETKVDQPTIITVRGEGMEGSLAGHVIVDARAFSEAVVVLDHERERARAVLRLVVRDEPLGHPEITVGNIVGADVLNVLFVIGAAAAAVPLAIPENFYYFHFPAMLIILYSFRVFISMNHEGVFYRWQGYWLLGVYLCYVILQYTLNIGSAH